MVVVVVVEVVIVVIVVVLAVVGVVEDGVVDRVVDVVVNVVVNVVVDGVVDEVVIVVVDVVKYGVVDVYVEVLSREAIVDVATTNVLFEEFCCRSRTPYVTRTAEENYEKYLREAFKKQAKRLKAAKEDQMADRHDGQYDG